MSSHAFAEGIAGSINRISNTRAWCTSCSKYQPTTQTRSLLELPMTLSINVDISKNDIAF